VGGAAAAPYGGTLRYVEARRLPSVEPTNGTRRGPFDGAVGSAIRTFARPPIDPVTGRRDHPIVGAAEIWRQA
jgi:hypothetical protein